MPWSLDGITPNVNDDVTNGQRRLSILNLPWRLLQLPRRILVFFGLALSLLVFISTFLFLAPDHRPAPVRDLVEDLSSWTPKWTTEGDLSSWTPKWTTEKLEPKFAYAQYATSMDYLCNAVINFGRLRRYGAKEDLVLIHPKDWAEGTSREAKALAKLRIERPEINMRAFDVISTNKGDATWRDSLTKFHAFALTEWTRILAFDSDSLVLNTMDHYFLSPKAPVAVPRAYWLNEQDSDIAKQVLGSHVMLIEPDEKRYHKIINEATKSGDFDMEVVNHMFKGSAMILPHRRLALLTGEFRAKDHSKYLAPEEDEEWNAMAEVSRSYLVHFSDWPLPKPWRPRTKQQWQAVMPECPDDAVAKPDQPRCADRFMWTGFYEDYDREKSNQCSILIE